MVHPCVYGVSPPIVSCVYVALLCVYVCVGSNFPGSAVRVHGVCIQKQDTATAHIAYRLSKCVVCNVAVWSLS